MKRFLLGLTGGMASGKSTVARRLAEEGFTVMDADSLVAKLYSPGQAGAAAVARLFGEDCLHPNGSVNHSTVAKVIFSDPGTRAKLEAAIHPLVRQRFRDLAAASEGVIVFEATLLVEAGQTKDFDLVLTVEAPQALRLSRAIARGMTTEEAEARLAAQGDGAIRRAGADRELLNEGSREDLHRAIGYLAEELRQHLTE